MRIFAIFREFGKNLSLILNLIVIQKVSLNRENKRFNRYTTDEKPFYDVINNFRSEILLMK